MQASPCYLSATYGVVPMAHLMLSVQVSADGEEVLYKACMNAGITMLSIGHRPALRKYHQVIVHFDGTQSGRGWSLEEVKGGGSYQQPDFQVGEAVEEA